MLPGSLSPAVARLIAVLGLTTLTGCTAARYLAQAGFGQLDISESAKDIDEVVLDRRTPARTRGLVAKVRSIKQFGERHGLLPTSNYTTYAELDRPAAVWVVTACQPLRFQPKTWSFPIVGSVPYLGWFDREDAQEFALELRAEGWDVDLRGASAYSTLGWFHDPVLSTMIAPGDEALGELAEVVLHESLHATHYVPGQSKFNESVADFVGSHLSSAYLDATVGPASLEKAAYLRAEEEHAKRRQAMHGSYLRLEELYASKASNEEKLANKAAILGELEKTLTLRRRPTNATLMQFKTYSSARVEIEQLLAACGGSFPRFVEALRTIGPSSFQEPQQEDVGRVIRAKTLALSRDGTVRGPEPRALSEPAHAGAASGPKPRAPREP